MVDLTPIINAVIALIFALISAYAIPYLKQKIGEARYKRLCELAKSTVKAAEQLYKGSGRGAEKKEYFKKILRQNGYDVDAESIVALMESFVYDL